MSSLLTLLCLEYIYFVEDGALKNKYYLCQCCACAPMKLRYAGDKILVNFMQMNNTG